MKVHSILGLSALLAGTVSASVPEVSDVTIAQNPGNHRVTVTYRLSGESGIVTLEILKDGEPIDGRLVDYVTGDVNKVVDVTEGDATRTIVWQAAKSWPNQRFDGPSISARVTAWATNTPPDYCVVDLTDGALRYYLSADYLPQGGLTNDVYRKTKLVLRKIPAGGVETTLGAIKGELSSSLAKEAPHRVRFSKDYYIGVYEVTQHQWRMIRGETDTYRFKFKNPDYADMRPVDGVFYQLIRNAGYFWTPSNPVQPEAASFLGKLRTLTGCPRFDLPTECQWEYACHGGYEGTFYNGKTYLPLNEEAKTNLAALARYRFSGGLVDGTTVPDMETCTTELGSATVGSYLPNGYGLYDMLGNVPEICREPVKSESNERTWSDEDIDDPVSSEGDMVLATHLTKGGSWYGEWYWCRPGAVGNRAGDTANGAGLRVVMELP